MQAGLRHSCSRITMGITRRREDPRRTLERPDLSEKGRR